MIRTDIDPGTQIMKRRIVRTSRSPEHTATGFFYSALKAWNDIPANIREIQNTRTLQERIKSALDELKMLETSTLKCVLLEE